MPGKATCEDCYFRRDGLCALAGEPPCPTFRAVTAAGKLEPPRQPRLVLRPSAPSPRPRPRRIAGVSTPSDAGDAGPEEPLDDRGAIVLGVILLLAAGRLDL